MPKTIEFTTITPLPAGITRKSVLDMYEDHMAMIDLNPLVVERFKCRPPSYAPSDEYFAAWYTIKDKVSYLPGKLAQGSVSYHACFRDTPEGLSTHIYAPLGLDIRGKWSVGGSLPGEAKPPVEKGLNVPRHGIYIREDVTMTCSTLLMGFVKRTFKDSHAALVEKLVERAHLLESSFANERLRALRNVEPGERMAIGNIVIAPPPDYRAWGYMSPSLHSPSEPSLSPRFECFELAAAPSPSALHRSRTNTQPSLSPYYSPLAHSHHSRSHSDPVTSPGFSSSSTLVSESDRPATPPKDDGLKLIIQPSPSAADPDLYLLPATTYNSSTSAQPVPLSPKSNSHTYKDSNLSLPHTCYTPEERPISFQFTNNSPFDTHSRTESAIARNHNLLDEIDDAIDQVFLYTIPSHTPTTRSPTPTSTNDTLPSTRYHRPDTLTAIESDFQNSTHFLPATTYNSNNNTPAKLILPQTKYPAGPPLPATKYNADSAKLTLPPSKYDLKATLPKTRYEPHPHTKQFTLPCTTYKPEPVRKDSAVPWLEKELPPVPLDG